MSLRRLGSFLVAACAACAVLSAGCVRRTVTINTVPEGARVTLNDRQVGTSPVSVDFTFYGDYSVIIEKDGYETLTTHQVVPRPWYQYPPVDFVAEALMPFTIHDQHAFEFELEPEKPPIPREELLDRATGFRDEALYGEE